MFYFGVDYYPEQWPEERWPIDVQLMAEAGSQSPIADPSLRVEDADQ